MANLGNFNAHDVEPIAPYETLPAGKYLAAVTNSQMKPTAKGDGSYLEIELTVLDGEHKDRKVWDRLCTNHPNATTVKIARSKLSAICHAVGVMQPRDSVELHNIPLVVTVKVKRRKDNDELANEIKGYEPKAAISAAKPTTANPAAPQAPAVSNTPPWKR
jgi:hypothetical protein